MFYAAHNTHADTRRGKRGFSNTWEIVRFHTRSARDEFVNEMSHRKAKAVTRKQAAEIFAGTYLSVGLKVPKGGLFNTERNYFWGEMT